MKFQKNISRLNMISCKKGKKAGFFELVSPMTCYNTDWLIALFWLVITSYLLSEAELDESRIKIIFFLWGVHISNHHKSNNRMLLLPILWTGPNVLIEDQYKLAKQNKITHGSVLGPKLYCIFTKLIDEILRRQGNIVLYLIYFLYVTRLE